MNPKTTQEMEEISGPQPLDRPALGGKIPSIVALLLVGGVLLWMVYGDDAPAPSRVQQKDESYAYRAASMPKEPAQAPAADPSKQQQREDRRSREDRERDERMQQAGDYARRMQEQAKERREDELRAKAEQEAKARREAADVRRRSDILVVVGGEPTEAPGEDDQSGHVYREQPGRAQQATGTAQVAFSPVPQANPQGSGAQGPENAQDRAYAFVPAGSTAVPTAVAQYGGDLAFRMRQGKSIPAVLETPVNTDQPGVVRAVVAEDVYGDDGRFVLLPRGSKLVGEFRAGSSRGSSRVFVIWHRAQRADGVDVLIESPGADALGTAGIAAEKDTHFFERFGAAILLSMIESYGRSQNDSVQVYSQDLSQASSIALRDSTNIPATLHADQGQRLSVLLTRDLVFESVGPLKVRARPE